VTTPGTEGPGAPEPVGAERAEPTGWPDHQAAPPVRPDSPPVRADGQPPRPVYVARPDGPRTPTPPSPTGWAGAPPRAPVAAVPVRPPAATEPARPPAPALPQRPSALDGVPARPHPLPPPRAVPGAVPTAATPRTPPSSAFAGSLATGAETVVPGRNPRPSVVSTGRPVRNRRAKLAIRRLDPWSVFVMSLLLSLFLAVVTIVAGFVLWAVLDKLGVPASINKSYKDVQGGSALLTRGRFLGGAALLAAANVVLLTAFATLGSLLYNLAATFTGGLELTLAEKD
jgi:hypothetical protein